MVVASGALEPQGVWEKVRLEQVGMEHGPGITHIGAQGNADDTEVVALQ